MITIQNLTRNYGDLVAVDDVSLEIQRGEIVGLLGHNGAGKTTVMKILTGYLEPSSGNVSVGGFDVLAERTRVQELIGYLPENAPVYPEMLVQEYLRMIGELRGIERGELDDSIREAVLATDLQERILDPIGTLSKGYRQRVGLAQAILHRPDVLVFDEPTNGLDPVQIQAIRDLIVRLGERSTIILSTHILQEVEAVCDRVLVMIEGQLAADSSLADLLSSHDVAISVDGGPGEVERGLARVPGVVSVRCHGDDPRSPGFKSFTAAWQGERPPVAALIDACREAGWALASVAPEQRTLESVFKDLQEEHIAKQSKQAKQGKEAA
jgi:ABC-2 type transport system ATP-binding protein